MRVTNGVKRVLFFTFVFASLTWSFSISAQDASPDEQLTLQIVAMRTMCFKAYPNLKEKIEANMFAGNSGLDNKMKEEIRLLESSKDPIILARIEGASIVFRDKAILEAGCNSFAGIKP